MNQWKHLKEFSNVKINWPEVLEPEILWKENQFPELNVRDRYLEIIRKLEQNQLRSRVIYSSDHVSAYCFLLNSGIGPGNIYANIGFLSENEAKDSRINTILDWLISLARNPGERIFFDRPFNAPDNFDSLCKDKSIGKVERIELKLLKYNRKEISMKPGDTTVLEPFLQRDVDSFAESEYSAYLSGPEEIFLPPSIRDLGQLIQRLFDPSGEERAIPEASFVARNQGNLVGGIIAVMTRTGPLLSDLFVLPAYRGRGISQHLISASLDSLMSRYPEVLLWSVSGTPAYDIYLKSGFRETGRKEILYFTKK